MSVTMALLLTGGSIWSMLVGNQLADPENSYGDVAAYAVVALLSPLVLVLTFIIGILKNI